MIFDFITMNIIHNRKIYLTVSSIVVGAALICIALFGFREGVDFSGGTLWQFRVDGGEEQAVVLQGIFKTDLEMNDVRLSFDETSKTFLARLPELSEQRHQAVLETLKLKMSSFEELGFASIGPSVGADLRSKSITALILVLVGISLYIAFAFRKVFRPVSSWKYGWVTLITLLHDVVIPAGLLAVLGKVGAVEIDGNFIVALLVVMGFSVHDTIVVFDRIRENLFLDRGKGDFGAIVNASVNQTMSRSINTSLTLILVLVALLILGPQNLHYFVLTLLVGVSIGIYSSIFVASPLLYVWHKFGDRKR